MKDIVTVQYLAACPLIEHIYVEGNEEIDFFPKRRQTIKNLVPKLKTLDGSPFTEGTIYFSRTKEMCFTIVSQKTAECREEFSDIDEDELEQCLQVTVDKKVKAAFSKEVN